MSTCLQAILKLPEEDQEAFAANMERAIRLGAQPDEARREAARMLLESIDAQTNEAIAEFKKQHPGALAGITQPEPNAEPVKASRRETNFKLPEFGAQDAFLSTYDPARPAATLLPAALAATKAQLAEAQEAIQDRYNRWKTTINQVQKQGGTVNEANDFYQAEERYWGKVGTQNEAFGREIESFVKAVQADGLELDDVALFAYAMHAPERNNYIATKRADMPDGGSGMSNDESDAILNAAEEAGLYEALQRHAETLHEWIGGTRDVLEDGGLITPETRAAWDRGFRHYVPLRGRAGKPDGLRIGKGFSMTGPESKRAMGRRSQAKQIIEQIIQDRTRAYIRAGKNEVLRSFLAFTLDNPSPNLWAVDAVEPKAVSRLDDDGHEVFVLEEREATGSNIINVKDGGRVVRIQVKDEALLRQLKGLDDQNVGRVIGAMLWANRKVGAMLTIYNPVFTVMNGARDFQAAAVGMTQQFGGRGALGLLGEYRSAFREAVRAELQGKPSGDYQVFKAVGGTTGFAFMGDLKAKEDDLRALMNRAQSRNIAMNAGRTVLRYIEACNAVVENATRFAAFQVARKQGKTTAQAASISKNITVNFNRKGTKTPWLSAFVMFFNPAMQGTARVAQNLASPAALALIGSGMVGAFLLALGNAEWGGEDEDGVSFWDKVPNDVKERNIVIMSPFGPTKGKDGKLEANYIKLPMAYNYNALKVFAEQAADQMRRSGDITAGRPAADSAVRVAVALIASVQPINAAGQSLEDSSALAMLPYSNALGPIFQAAANRNSFGRPMHPERQKEAHLPDANKVSASQAGTVFHRAAQRINEATGGSRYESGLIDLTPGALENAVRFYGGGIAQFSLDLANAFYARQHIERDKPELWRLPFSKQLLGQINSETDRIGYDRLRQADEATQQFELAARAGDGDAIDSLLLKHGPIATASKSAENVRATLSRLRKQELSVLNDEGMTDSAKLAELAEIQTQVREALGHWNELFDDLARDGERDRQAANLKGKPRP